MSGQEQIFDRVQQVLVETFGVSHAAITMDTHLYNDLELDSFDAIDLSITLEVETGIKLEEDDLRSIRRISDIVEVVVERSNA